MEYSLPIAVRGWQNAENIETLLQKKVLQIGLNEKVFGVIVFLVVCSLINIEFFVFFWYYIGIKI